MIITTHQPLFLPWPGFFFKAVNADCMVLLDNVQFPLGRGWMNRNRLKCDKGELWLTVPISRKGRGLQMIREVGIVSDVRWCEKHLRAVRQNYAHAPFMKEYSPAIEAIYRKRRNALVSLNLDLIRFFMDSLSLKAELVLQSELGVTGAGTDLIVAICEKCGAEEYAAFPAAQSHLDKEKFEKSGIQVDFIRFVPPVYPQLWGDFIYNLSTLDMLLNCGPESSTIILEAGGHVSG